jgi:hypothetical protein
MIPARYTLGVTVGKRERNGGRCFQKRNATFPKEQEQLDWVLCTVPSPYTTEIPATSYESWNPFSFCDSDKWDLNSVVRWTTWKGTPWDHSWGCNNAAHKYSHAGWVPWCNTMGVWRSNIKLNELSHLNNTKGGMLFMQNLIYLFWRLIRSKELPCLVIMYTLTNNNNCSSQIAHVSALKGMNANPNPGR